MGPGASPSLHEVQNKGYESTNLSKIRSIIYDDILEPGYRAIVQRGSQDVQTTIIVPGTADGGGGRDHERNDQAGEERGDASTYKSTHWTDASPVVSPTS